MHPIRRLASSLYLTGAARVLALAGVVGLASPLLIRLLER